MKVIGEANYKQEVVDVDGVFLLDIYATWCGPCRALAPLLTKLDGVIPGVTIGKMNFDDNVTLGDTLGVNSLPTLIFYKDGREFKRHVGLMTEEQLRTVLTDASK